MKAFVISIDWYGPYTRPSFKQAAIDNGNYSGLYMALSGENGVKSIKYIGLSKTNLPFRVGEPHPTLGKIIDPEMWGGIISYHNAPNNSGDGTSVSYKNAVDDAERILIYMFQPMLNVDRRDPLPTKPAIVVNRWFYGEEPYERRSTPVSAIPDFLEYDPEAGATLAWHDDPTRVQRMSASEVKALGFKKS